MMQIEMVEMREMENEGKKDDEEGEERDEEKAVVEDGSHTPPSLLMIDWLSA